MALTDLQARLLSARWKGRGTPEHETWQAISWRAEGAAGVVKKIHKLGTEPHPRHRPFAGELDGREVVVECEPDPRLRDTKQVPLMDEGGNESFIRHEVLPYVPDAWIDEGKTKRYEISFNRVFCTPPELRSLAEIRVAIEAPERETEELMDDVLVGTVEAA